VGSVRNFLGRFGFSTRLSLTATALVLLFIAATAALAIITYNAALKDLRAANAEASRLFLVNQAEQIAVSRTQSLAMNLVNAVYFWRMDDIRNLLETEQSAPTARYVYLVDPSGRILADGKNTISLIGKKQTDERIFKVLAGGPAVSWMDADTLHAVAAVKLNNRVLGAAITGSTLKEIKAKITVSQTYMGWISENSKQLFFSGLIAMTALLAAISIVLTFIVARSITLPVRKLADITRSIGAGHYDTSDLPVRSDELGDLSNALRDAASHRKEAETQLLKAKEAAESASRMKSQFLMTVSHELRTPLNPIIGFSETLAANVNKMEDAKVLEALNIINTSGRQLHGIVNDVLDLARFEAGDIQLSAKKIAVSELLQNMDDQSRFLMRKTGNKMTTEYDENAGEIVTDEAKLRHVLANLIDNAAKFTDHGNIHLRARRENDAVVFEVEDNGMGIESTKLETIFEPFVQINAAYDREHYGSGLGLAIVRQYVQLLGGSVHVTSAPGQGSCFSVRIPAQPSSAETPTTH
jgi:signal transduction histidine kinase